jgi:Tfp pilus assembly protein PilF
LWVAPLLAVLVFLPGWWTGFVNWDDTRYIRDNPLLADPTGLLRIWTTFDAPQYYPLTFTTFWLEHQYWGASPTGYFATNLALHSLNSLLVFLIARRLGLGAPLAALAACIFAAHPMQTASVAWLAQRKNTLSGLFALLALLTYIEYRDSGKTWRLIAATVLFAAGLLSKTAIVLLPIALIALDLMKYRKTWGQALSATGAMMAVAAVLSLTTLAVETERSAAAFESGPRIANAMAATWFYVGKFFYPDVFPALYPAWSLSIGSPFAWAAAIGCVLAGALIWKYRLRLGVTTTWAAVLYICMLFPTLGFIPFGYLQHAPVADHFAYLAIAAIALFLSGAAQAAIHAWPNASRRVATALGVIGAAGVVAMSVRTALHVPVWNSGVSLWAYTIEHNPTSALARNNYGVALSERDDVQAAVREFEQAVELDPNLWTARTNLGVAYNRLGESQRALSVFRAAIDRAPDDAVVWFNYARFLQEQLLLSQAVEAYRQAIRLDSQYTAALTNLGALLFEGGQIDAAERALRDSLAILPSQPLALFTLARCAGAGNRLDESLSHYESALTLAPDNAHFRMFYGMTLLAHGRAEEAIRELGMAAVLAPDDAAIHLNYGSVLAQLGELDAAEEHLRRAYELDPNSPDTLNNYGALLLQIGSLESALKFLTQADEARPDHPNTLFLLGSVQRKLGHLAAAKSVLVRAIGLNADDEEALTELAKTCQEEGDLLTAAENYQKALERRPAYLPAVLGFAWIKATSADPAVRNADAAIAALERARSAGAPETTAFLDVLAAALAAKGRWEDAVATADRALVSARVGEPHLPPEVIAEIEQRRNGYDRQVAHVERQKPTSQPGKVAAPE